MQSSIAGYCALSLLIMSLLGGCAGSSQKRITPPKIPSSSSVARQKPQAPGSLYTGYENLFSDAKAYNVGDTVTIRIVENITGSGSTDTKASRSNKMGLNIPYPTVNDKQLTGNKTMFGLNQKSTNDFQGKGGTKRSAKLIANIAARVVKVYPNGNMFIVGEKYIKINDDTQILKISGIINPRDISSDNTIDSSKIADMYVEYNGEGFTASTQKPGWLANFIMKIWPF